MVSIGKKKEKSQLQTQQVPGAFGGGEDAQRLAETLEALLGTSPVSSFQQSLSDAILKPGDAAANQQALMTAALGATQGAGPQTSEAGIQRALAPSFLQQNQQNISNLQRAVTGEQQSLLTDRGTTAKGLLGLIGLAMPEIIAGQLTKGTSKPPNPFDPFGIMPDVFGVNPGKLGDKIF